ncbi:hypothetical protein [Microcella sp.]|uniref:hypothetical protein n=1 Tax=Microcella sp. TaxID=1913979 RepID=UPI00391C0937
MVTAPSTDSDTENGERASTPAWLAPIARAIPAIVVGLVITFTPDHSATMGLISLGVFGAVTAVVLVLTTLRLAASEPVRSLHRGLSVITAVVAAASFALVAGLEGNLLPFLLLTLGAYGVFAGAYEIVWGLRHRGVTPLARDGITVGAGTIILALILVAVGDSVSAVGFFGAYAVIVGVYLIIAGFSAKWAATSAKEQPTP